MNHAFARKPETSHVPGQHTDPASPRPSEYGLEGRKAAAAEEAEVRWVIMARRMRDAAFSHELFADPAWDILLELYAAGLAQRRVSTSELCVCAAVPATTGLRWIEKLHRAGLLKRVDDSHDHRRVWVELLPEAELKVRSYFRAIGGIRSAI
jgi:DNA-binding MarR family transcriptional regulator